MRNSDDEPKHLNPQARAALSLPNDKRIERLKAERWIGYSSAKDALVKLEELLVHPKKHRMPNMLLVGETNNGKTMIVNRFLSQHPAFDNPDGEGVIVPVLLIQSPPVPDEGRFYNSIFEKLFHPYKESDRPQKKQFQAINALDRVKVRLLIIDELHNLIAGNLNKQRAFLNTIKYLSNELQIPLIGVGTNDALVALRTDAQLANRFEPFKLPRWEMGTEYLQLLASFERMLPLRRPSGLIDESVALKLLTMSDGLIGELSAILGKAAALAIVNGTERIELKALKGMPWIPPSERYLPSREI